MVSATYWDDDDADEQRTLAFSERSRLFNPYTTNLDVDTPRFMVQSMYRKAKKRRALATGHACMHACGMPDAGQNEGPRHSPADI